MRAVREFYLEVVHGEDLALPDLLVPGHTLKKRGLWFECPANLVKACAILA